MWRGWNRDHGSRTEGRRESGGTLPYWTTRECLHATVRASRGTSVDGDSNALRFHARLLRDRNLKHAISVTGLDRFSLR
jgi:hypothetical protein